MILRKGLFLLFLLPIIGMCQVVLPPFPEQPPVPPPAMLVLPTDYTQTKVLTVSKCAPASCIGALPEQFDQLSMFLQHPWLSTFSSGGKLYGVAFSPVSSDSSSVSSDSTAGIYTLDLTGNLTRIGGVGVERTANPTGQTSCQITRKALGGLAYNPAKHDESLIVRTFVSVTNKNVVSGYDPCDETTPGSNATSSTIVVIKVTNKQNGL